MTSAASPARAGRHGPRTGGAVVCIQRSCAVGHGCPQWSGGPQHRRTAAHFSHSGDCDTDRRDRESWLRRRHIRSGPRPACRGHPGRGPGPFRCPKQTDGSTMVSHNRRHAPEPAAHGVPAASTGGGPRPGSGDTRARGVDRHGTDRRAPSRSNPAPPPVDPRAPRTGRGRRHRLRAGLAVAVVALTLVASVPTLLASADRAAAAPGDSVTIGLDRNFPDPSFIHVDGTYYAFSTGNGFPVASAPSIRGPWTVLGKSMPTRPSWTVRLRRPAPGTGLRTCSGATTAGSSCTTPRTTGPRTGSAWGPPSPTHRPARTSTPPPGPDLSVERSARVGPLAVHQARRHTLDHLQRGGRPHPGHPG